MKEFILIVVLMFLFSGCEFMKGAGEFLGTIENVNVTLEDGTVLSGGCKKTEDGGKICHGKKDGKGFDIKFNAEGEEIERTEKKE